jgi:single-strand DNA-binding protein
MPAFNKVILVGNLTRDCEIRYTPKGTAVAQFGLAINRQWTSEAGEKKEAVCFVDCKCFAKSAENLSQYTKKGHPLLVEGRLDLEQWEDKESKENRQKLVVCVEGFQFLRNKDKSEPQD